MKKPLIAALIASAIAVATPSLAASKADDAIKQVLAQLDRCFAASDPTCLGRLFVEDATYVAPVGDAKIIKGKARILKLLTESMGDLEKQNMKLAHSLENVRMIGEGHAVADISIKVGGQNPPQDGTGDSQHGSYRAVAVMALEGGTWLCQDLRSYVVGNTTQSGSGAGAHTGPAPAEGVPTPPAKAEPASPTQG
ncbi:MAG: nuclear transport factor 2 family protein [Deltaproteobacteria bacterium]|nr:nuclear transport factor 2 family protein [Deltaproteobacteria bacterium]